MTEAPLTISVPEAGRKYCKLAEVGTLVEAISILREARALATRIINERWGDVCNLARRLHQRGELSQVDVTNILPELRAAA
jgi:hypothetical protein